jgi:hypothetical protein
VGVVGRDPEQDSPVREYAVPDLIRGRVTATAKIVRAAYLEERDAAAVDVLGADGGAEETVRVIEHGYATGLFDRPRVSLDRIRDVRSPLGCDSTPNTQAIEVHGTTFDPIGDLHSGEQQELTRRLETSREIVRDALQVVIGEHQEVVAAAPVPLDHLRRGREAIGSVTMDVDIAPVP